MTVTGFEEEKRKAEGDLRRIARDLAREIQRRLDRDVSEILPPAGSLLRRDMEALVAAEKRLARVEGEEKERVDG